MNITIEGKPTAGSNSNGKQHSTNNLIHRIRNGAFTTLIECVVVDESLSGCGGFLL